MSAYSEESKEELHRRLRRIEGQVRGIQRMLDEGRDCKEIVQQLSAVRSAVHQATLLFMRDYACLCLMQTEGEDRTELVQEVVNLLAKAS